VLHARHDRARGRDARVSIGASETTQIIYRNLDAAFVQAALEALPNIGAGNVTVDRRQAPGCNPDDHVQRAPVPSAISRSLTFTSSLTGGTAPAVKITTDDERRQRDNRRGADAAAHGYPDRRFLHAHVRPHRRQDHRRSDDGAHPVGRRRSEAATQTTPLRRASSHFAIVADAKDNVFISGDLGLQSSWYAGQPLHLQPTRSDVDAHRRCRSVRGIARPHSDTRFLLLSTTARPGTDDVNIGAS